MVTEKELKIAETQKIMGLKRLNYILAEFIFYTLKTCVLVLIPMLILLLTNFYGTFNYYKGGGLMALYFLNLLLFIISMISFNLFLTTFFSKAKFASEITLLINVVLSFFYVMVLIYHGTETENINIFV